MLLQQGLELLHQNFIALVGEANLLVRREDFLLREQLLERGELLLVKRFLPHVGVLRQELPVPPDGGVDVDNVILVQRPQHLHGVAARRAVGVLRDFEVEGDRLVEALFDVGVLSLLL